MYVHMCGSPPQKIYFLILLVKTQSNGDTCSKMSTGKPNVTVAPASSTVMRVSWMGNAEITGRGTLESYTIICRSPQDRTFFHHHSVTDLDSSSYDLTGLFPHTSYNCCVAVVTNEDSGPLACVVNSTLQGGKRTVLYDVSLVQ